MGKKLIIKNADFSANGIASVEPTWSLGYTSAELIGNTGFTNTNNYYIIASEIQSLGLSGKVISALKFYASGNGNITVGKVSISGSSASIVESFVFQVNSGENIIYLPNSITLSSSQSISFSGRYILTYNHEADPSVGWKFSWIGSSTVSNVNFIPIDFGYFES